jgi:hypothetical protein
LAGPEAEARGFLPEWGGSDRYLREAMFGPEHARKAGRAGLAADDDGLDPDLPGFGPFGTAGCHCFDEASPTYRRLSAMGALRKRHRMLRSGRQYLRQTAFLDRGFDVHGPGELLAWSRILDDHEALCVVNSHGRDPRGADVVVDANLNPPGTGLTVMLNTAEVARVPGAPHRVGTTLPVMRAPDGTAFVQVRDLPPSETLVLVNHA